MKAGKKSYLRIAVPVALALLLTVGAAGAVLAQEPPEGRPDGAPVGGPPGGTSPGGGAVPPGGTPPGVVLPGGTTPPGVVPPVATPHPDAPSGPSHNCYVRHGATPAQLCPVGDGLQYYFIGADGSARTGPHLSSVGNMAMLYAAGANVALYNGVNPFTGKPVHIDYLPAERKILVRTYYPDTQYDVNKPYVFTIDSNNSVQHVAW